MHASEIEPDPGYKWRLAVFLFFASALNYGDRTAITALYPLLQKEFHLSDIGLAGLGSAFLWSYAACSPIAGMLADRLPRARLVIFSLFAWSVVTALTGLVSSPQWLLTLRGALGVVESLYVPASVALLAAHHPVATRAKAISIHLSGLSVGMVAGGTISGFLASRYGWRIPLLGLGGLGIFIALLGYFVIGDGRVRDIDNSAAALPLADAEAPSFAKSLATLLNGLRQLPLLVLFFEIMFMGAGVWGLINWLPLYFHEHYDMSLGKAALFGSLFLQTGSTLGVIAGGWPSDYLARRNNNRRMILFGCFYLAAAPLMLVFLLPVGAGTVAAVVFTYGLLRGMGGMNSNPLVCELMPPHARSTAIGFMNMLACMVGGLGVMVAGALKHTHGLEGVFASITFVTAICGVLLLIGAWRMGKPRETATDVSCDAESLRGVAAINNEV